MHLFFLEPPPEPVPGPAAQFFKPIKFSNVSFFKAHVKQAEALLVEAQKVCDFDEYDVKFDQLIEDLRQYEEDLHNPPDALEVQWYLRVTKMISSLRQHIIALVKKKDDLLKKNTELIKEEMAKRRELSQKSNEILEEYRRAPASSKERSRPAKLSENESEFARSGSGKPEVHSRKRQSPYPRNDESTHPEKRAYFSKQNGHSETDLRQYLNSDKRSLPARPSSPPRRSRSPAHQSRRSPERRYPSPTRSKQYFSPEQRHPSPVREPLIIRRYSPPPHRSPTPPQNSHLPLRRSPSPSRRFALRTQQSHSPPRRSPPPTNRSHSPNRRYPTHTHHPPPHQRRSPMPTHRSPSPTGRYPPQIRQSPPHSRRSPVPTNRSPSPTRRYPPHMRQPPSHARRSPGPSNRSPSPSRRYPPQTRQPHQRQSPAHRSPPTNRRYSPTQQHSRRRSPPSNRRYPSPARHPAPRRSPTRRYPMRPSPRRSPSPSRRFSPPMHQSPHRLQSLLSMDRSPSPGRRHYSHRHLPSNRSPSPRRPQTYPKWLPVSRSPRVSPTRRFPAHSRESSLPLPPGTSPPASDGSPSRDDPRPFIPMSELAPIDTVPKEIFNCRRKPLATCFFCNREHWSHLCVKVNTLEERQDYYMNHNLCFNCGKSHRGITCRITDNLCKWPHCAAIGEHHSALCTRAPYPISFEVVKDYLTYLIRGRQIYYPNNWN